MVATLRKMWTQAVGLEMEASGAAAVTHEHPTRPSFILIKGVCDYADASKNDDWQSYAADAAGRYTISLLINRGSSSALHRTPSPRDVTLSPATTILTDPKIQIGLTSPQLLAILTDGFDLSELELMCFELNVEWEEIRGRETRSGAAMSIIRFFQKRAGLPQLLTYIKDKRPGFFDEGRLTL